MSTTPSPKKKPTPEEVDKIMGTVDGALGAAGHRVDDPETRETLRANIAGEITGEEARRRILAAEGL